MKKSTYFPLFYALFISETKPLAKDKRFERKESNAGNGGESERNLAKFGIGIRVVVRSVFLLRRGLGLLPLDNPLKTRIALVAKKASASERIIFLYDERNKIIKGNAALFEPFLTT